MRRALVCLPVVALLLSGCRGNDRTAAAPAATSTTATSTTTTVPPAPATTAPPLEVTHRTETFVDATRQRRLDTTIWYPPTGGPYPLVVFAHGYGATGPMYDVLTRPLAAAGFVVAAPTFPRSSGGAPGGPMIADVVNQPADVSFVIDRMLALDALRGRIDGERIAAAGHSLGAITTLGVALNTCCRDNRLDAAVVLAGLEWPFSGGRYTAGRGMPVLFVHGDADNIVPYAAGRRAYADAAPPKWFVTVVGGGHVASAIAVQQAVFRSVVDFLDGELRDDQGALARLATDGNTAGVTRLDHAG